MIDNFKFIDLFCGIGGFHQAMESLGGECVFACDIDKYCQATYYKNYGIRPLGDITQVDAADIPAHDVLCGGFPCQAFSIAGKRLGFADPTKGTLFFDIMRIVHHHQPKYILLENVRNLASHDKGNTWKVIHQNLCDAGYNVSEKPVIFSPHYIGIPQHRERVFIMAIRKDVGELPDFYFNRRKAKPCSIDTILQDDSEIPNIEKYRMKKGDMEIIDLWNEFLQGLRQMGIKMPCFPVTDLLLYDQISKIDISLEHAEKAMFARRNIELYNKCPEFINEWLRKAYKNPKFKGAKRMLEWHAGQPDNPNLWDTVIQFRQSGVRARRPTHFPTLTAVVQTPIIGKRRRRLTPRECARLQSFPDSFKYDRKEHQAYKQFGNSVNVEVVKLFARFLLGDPETQETYRRHPGDPINPEKDYRRPLRPVTLTKNGKRRGRPPKYPRPEYYYDEDGELITAEAQPQFPNAQPLRELDPEAFAAIVAARPPRPPKPPREPKPPRQVVLTRNGKRRGRPPKYPRPEGAEIIITPVDTGLQSSAAKPRLSKNGLRLGRPSKTALEMPTAVLATIANAPQRHSPAMLMQGIVPAMSGSGSGAQLSPDGKMPRLSKNGKRLGRPPKHLQAAFAPERPTEPRLPRLSKNGKRLGRPPKQK